MSRLAGVMPSFARRRDRWRNLRRQPKDCWTTKEWEELVELVGLELEPFSGREVPERSEGDREPSAKS